MSEPHRPPAGEPGAGGFTLVEMMVAIGILAFGVVSLLGLMGVGVSTHRTAEQNTRAAFLAERLLQQVDEQIVPEALRAAAADVSAGELVEVPAVESPPEGVDGFPGMKYRIEFVTDAARPRLTLVRVRVSWLEQGQAEAVELQRIVVNQIPFPQRIARLRGSNP